MGLQSAARLAEESIRELAAILEPHLLLQRVSPTVRVHSALRRQTVRKGYEALRVEEQKVSDD